MLSHVHLFATLCTVAYHTLSWNSPGKNNEVGSHCLLQENFLTQGSNSCLLHILKIRQILYYWVIGGAQTFGTGGLNFTLSKIIKWNILISYIIVPRISNKIQKRKIDNISIEKWLSESYLIFCKSSLKKLSVPLTF